MLQLQALEPSPKNRSSFNRLGPSDTPTDDPRRVRPRKLGRSGTHELRRSQRSSVPERVSGKNFGGLPECMVRASPGTPEWPNRRTEQNIFNRPLRSSPHSDYAIQAGQVPPTCREWIIQFQRGLNASKHSTDLDILVLETLDLGLTKRFNTIHLLNIC